MSMAHPPLTHICVFIAGPPTAPPPPSQEGIGSRTPCTCKCVSEWKGTPSTVWTNSCRPWLRFMSFLGIEHVHMGMGGSDLDGQGGWR